VAPPPPAPTQEQQSSNGTISLKLKQLMKVVSSAKQQDTRALPHNTWLTVQFEAVDIKVGLVRF
jgi:hypothetical protein